MIEASERTKTGTAQRHVMSISRSPTAGCKLLCWGEECQRHVAESLRDSDSRLGETRPRGAMARCLRASSLLTMAARSRPFEERTMPTKPVPDGYHTATPYLIVAGAA